MKDVYSLFTNIKSHNLRVYRFIFYSKQHSLQIRRLNRNTISHQWFKYFNSTQISQILETTARGLPGIFLIFYSPAQLSSDCGGGNISTGGIVSIVTDTECTESDTDRRTKQQCPSYLCLL